MTKRNDPEKRMNVTIVSGWSLAGGMVLCFIGGFVLSEKLQDARYEMAGLVLGFSYFFYEIWKLSINKNK